MSNSKERISEQFEKCSEQRKWYLVFSEKNNYLTLVKGNTFRKTIWEKKNLVEYVQNFAEELEVKLKNFEFWTKHKICLSNTWTMW